MPRTPAIVLILALFAVGGIAGRWYATHGHSARRFIAPATSAALVVSATATEVVNASATQGKWLPPTATAEEARQWSLDATSDDIGARSAAIAALATAPAALAVPVLRRVLVGGDSDVRLLALQSLQTLALQQGDADGKIRDALRDAIYHGDDEAGTRSAQTALDVVEHNTDSAAVSVSR